MRQKKIVLNTGFEDHNDNDLFAIHSPSEDFFLAFQLNKTLGTRFINVTEKIKPQAKIPFFSRFICVISPVEAKWELIANHFKTISKTCEENQINHDIGSGDERLGKTVAGPRQHLLSRRSSFCARVNHSGECR